MAKHFLGFHNFWAAFTGGKPDTAQTSEEVYGKPFQAAIVEANLHGVMPCYCTFDGEAASSSRRMLTDLLREEMGFDGLSVSDYSAIENQYNIQGLYESRMEAGLRSMEAGMDMEWPAKSCYNDELKQWFCRWKGGCGCAGRSGGADSDGEIPHGSFLSIPSRWRARS